MPSKRFPTWVNIDQAWMDTHYVNQGRGHDIRQWTHGQSGLNALHYVYCVTHNEVGCLGIDYEE